MLFSNKKILVLAICAALSSSAVADFNPFNVFNSSSNNNASATNNNDVAATQQNVTNSDDSVSAAPVNGATATTAVPASVSTTKAAAPSSSSYIKMPTLSTPTTAPMNTPTAAGAKASSAGGAPAFSTNAQPFSANHYNASQAATQATLNLPISGSGASTNSSNNSSGGLVFNSNSGASPSAGMVPTPSPNPSPSPVGGGILQVLEAIEQNVSSLNNNTMNWQAQKAQNEKASADMLIPSTAQELYNFLFAQSGFNLFLNLPQLAFNTPMPSSSTAAASANAPTLLPIQQLLQPTTQAQALALVGGGSNANNLQNYYQGVASQYYSTLVGGLPGGAQNLNLDRTSFYNLISTAINQVALQTQPSATGDSPMHVFQQAVNAPFINGNASSSVSGVATTPSWFQQLSVSSTPQILRMLAILWAENNQIQYQQLKNTQTGLALQAGQLAEATAIEQAVIKLNNNQQQTNYLLNKILAQMVAQNSKQ